MTIFDRKLRLVAAVFALVASVQADQPKQQGEQAAPAVLRGAEQDYLRGIQFADGKGVPRDYIQAARYYRMAAVKGYIPAQYNLAWLFEQGLGVKQDFEEAAAWYRKAADQGDADSQNNLGTLYATGRGVPRDDGEAVRWYSLAAKQDDPEALSNLATMYLQGRGVKRDPSQAFQLCKKSAEAGYAAGQNNLALMYANGDGVSRDYVFAYAWLDLAAGEMANSARLRDRIATEMTTREIARARELASKERQKIDARGKDR